MLDALLPYGGLAVATVVVWAAGLARLGVLTPRDLAAWRHLARLRGFGEPPTRLERAARRVSTLRRVQRELDLEHLLAVAGRDDGASGFLVQTALIAFAGVAAILMLGIVLRLAGTGADLPPALLLLVPLGLTLLQFSRLRAAARRRRNSAGRTLGDMMMLVAVLTDGRGLQLSDAVRILARCARTPELAELVDGGWRRLLGDERRSTLETYRLVAERYDIPEFAAVTEALQTTNVGIAERDTYTRVAQSVYQQRLAEARERAARARILVTLPVAGMLVPLLVLLGAPTFVTISTGLGGH